MRASSGTQILERTLMTNEVVDNNNDNVVIAYDVANVDAYITTDVTATVAMS